MSSSSCLPTPSLYLHCQQALITSCYQKRSLFTKPIFVSQKLHTPRNILKLPFYKNHRKEKCSHCRKECPNDNCAYCWMAWLPEQGTPVALRKSCSPQAVFLSTNTPDTKTQPPICYFPSSIRFSPSISTVFSLSCKK